MPMKSRRLNKECLSLYEEFRGNKGHGQVTFTIRSMLRGPLRTHIHASNYVRSNLAVYLRFIMWHSLHS